MRPSMSISPRQLHGLPLNVLLFNDFEDKPARVKTHYGMQTAPAGGLHMPKSPNKDQWRIMFFGRFQPQSHRHNDATSVIRIVVYRPLTRASNVSHLPHPIPSNYSIANQTLTLYTLHTSPTQPPRCPSQCHPRPRSPPQRPNLQLPRRLRTTYRTPLHAL